MVKFIPGVTPVILMLLTLSLTSNSTNLVSEMFHTETPGYWAMTDITKSNRRKENNGEDMENVIRANVKVSHLIKGRRGETSSGYALSVWDTHLNSKHYLLRLLTNKIYQTGEEDSEVKYEQINLHIQCQT